jgi:hypothetical protein
MTRSRKKHPAGGVAAAPSEKEDKQRASRAYRRAVRATLDTDTERELPLRRETSNAATFQKDGKKWFGDAYPQIVRK